MAAPGDRIDKVTQHLASHLDINMSESKDQTGAPSRIGLQECSAKDSKKMQVEQRPSTITKRR